MSVLNIKPQYLYATLLDEKTAVSEGIATMPSACAHSGGCLTTLGGFRDYGSDRIKG